VDVLLKAGKSVIATTRNREALQAKLNATYDAETLKRLLVVGLDVTKVDDVKAAFAKGIDKFGRIDVVVNNAAFVSLSVKLWEEKLSIKSHSNQSILGEVEVIPDKGAHEQFDVLFWGPVYISREVSGVPLLRILNMLYIVS
jgi:NAD(P)-dependent dehydrogenase (short-subunit alcohol dehydrogenase family)